MIDDVDDQLEDLGPLKVLRVHGDPDAPTIVLFHGYGASAFDLYPLHEVLTTEQKFNWVFPNGHLSIPIMPGYFGRAWFPIDIIALQEAMQRGDFRDLADKEPDGLDVARQSALLMLDALDIPFNQIIIGGFSQGAMLSCDLSLRSEKSPKGLIILSGTLLSQTLWREFAQNHTNLRFFQSHGDRDPVLGYANAKRLEKLFRESGLLGEFVGFSGGHEIPQVVIQGLSRYLNSLS